MSEHSTKAEESAERAGGYLQSAEVAAKRGGFVGADAYAQMATTSAILSVAQRIADQTDKLADIEQTLDMIRLKDMTR